MVSRPRDALFDTPLTNPDSVYFVDGSAMRDPSNSSLCVSYAVCTEHDTVESASSGGMGDPPCPMMEKPQLWHTFEVHGCDFRRSMCMILVLNTMAIIPFIIHDLTHTERTSSGADNQQQLDSKHPHIFMSTTSYADGLITATRGCKGTTWQ